MIYLSFCERLKEERLSKGLNQDDFSAVGEVTKRSQINYEKGDRVPDSDYLMNLLKIGVDVNYILTGNRNVSDPVIQALANAFKNADEGTRQVVCRVLDLDLSKIKDDADQNKPSIKIENSSVGALVTGNQNNVNTGIINNERNRNKK